MIDQATWLCGNIAGTSRDFCMLIISSTNLINELSRILSQTHIQSRQFIQDVIHCATNLTRDIKDKVLKYDERKQLVDIAMVALR